MTSPSRFSWWIVGTYSSVFAASPLLVVWHSKSGGRLVSVRRESGNFMRTQITQKMRIEILSRGFDLFHFQYVISSRIRAYLSNKFCFYLNHDVSSIYISIKVAGPMQQCLPNPISFSCPGTGGWFKLLYESAPIILNPYESF
jgi:hypothetical protein